MIRIRCILTLVFFVFTPLCRGQNDLEEIPEIPRRIPPTDGIVIDPDVRGLLEKRTAELEELIWSVDFKDYAADAGVLVKAVKFALDLNEFYHEKEIPIATRLLNLAEKRYREIDSDSEPSWINDTGLVIRGFRSNIDDSYQPYGLEVPDSLDLTKPVPLLVWLHGRGDKITDLHFVERCLTKSQAFGGFVKDQEDAIILHPFGRHCVGWKHAGEIDIFEAIEAVAKDYPIDRDRIALAGFSMGGAGAWHVGAHYRDRFCAVHAGAGFAETKEYNRLTPEQYGPEYVQELWQIYDVPNYIRNFLNGPVLAYSGSEDKQKQAADLIAREMDAIDHDLPHVIGDGMGHKYNESSVEKIWKWLNEAWEKGRDPHPAKVIWQTPTLRYSGFSWLQLTGLKEHWHSALATGTWDSDKKKIQLEVENISALSISPSKNTSLAGYELSIGDVSLPVDDPGFPVEAVSLIEKNGKWTWGEPRPMSKRPKLQGPIDDAFMQRFVVVLPERRPTDSTFARWVDFEIDHFRSRWKALMRGDLILRAPDELDSEDISDANLILWGDIDSNSMIREIAEWLPIKWKEDQFTFQEKSYSRDTHALAMVFPNPLNPDRYIVLNSGLTFREDHDKTNSQQNPKLPDWAIIGLEKLPDETAPGEILEAGFFSEEWK